MRGNRSGNQPRLGSSDSKKADGEAESWNSPPASVTTREHGESKECPRMFPGVLSEAERWGRNCWVWLRISPSFSGVGSVTDHGLQVGVIWSPQLSSVLQLDDVVFNPLETMFNLIPLSLAKVGVYVCGVCVRGDMHVLVSEIEIKSQIHHRKYTFKGTKRELLNKHPYLPVMFCDSKEITKALKLTNSLSLPLQTLDLNLLRIQHRGKQRKQQAKQPPDSCSSKMYHPACWIVFTATTALLFIPGVELLRVTCWCEVLRILSGELQGSGKGAHQSQAELCPAVLGKLRCCAVLCGS
ncbi:hypothetical protein KIL84_008240 [Mauremys mutica]|uniref:Uncharacterized protein n=1 Tax=Mauremys mutica TaxID=74926 RepID=A0A9D4B072_9SAUR|nr:hypothetical protein KIL84_008240 [Mauremys mutica]